MIRITLPPPTADDCYVIVVIEKGNRLIDPTWNNFAITIDELHIAEISCQLTQTIVTSIPRARGREWNFHVEFDDITASTSALYATEPSVEPEST